MSPDADRSRASSSLSPENRHTPCFLCRTINGSVDEKCQGTILALFALRHHSGIGCGYLRRTDALYRRAARRHDDLYAASAADALSDGSPPVAAQSGGVGAAGRSHRLLPDSVERYRVDVRRQGTGFHARPPIADLLDPSCLRTDPPADRLRSVAGQQHLVDGGRDHPIRAGVSARYFQFRGQYRHAVVRALFHADRRHPHGELLPGHASVQCHRRTQRDERNLYDRPLECDRHSADRRGAGVDRLCGLSRLRRSQRVVLGSRHLLRHHSARRRHGARLGSARGLSRGGGKLGHRRRADGLRRARRYAVGQCDPVHFTEENGRHASARDDSRRAHRPAAFRVHGRYLRPAAAGDVRLLRPYLQAQIPRRRGHLRRRARW